MADNQKFFYSVFDRLNGGLKTYPAPYKIGDDAFKSLNSFFTTPHASLELREGQTGLYSSVSGQEISAIARATISGGVERLVFSLASLDVFALNEGSSTLTAVTALARIYPLSRFAMFDSSVIFVAEIGLSDEQVMIWDGSATADTLGVRPPSVATTTAAFAGSGNLSAIAGDPVYYWVTFVNSHGVESNPVTVNGLFVPSNALSKSSLADTFSVSLTGIPNSTGMIRRIYRQGGGLPSPRLVQELAAGIATTASDNLSNFDAQDRPELSFSHDAPPLATEDTLTFCLSYKRRLFLFGQATVYISTLNQPWYFPLIQTFPQIDGQVMPMDGDLQNPIRGACAIGGPVFIARAKDCWMLQGDDTDSFSLNGVCTIGNIAPLSLVSCGNVPVWLSPDRQVWAYTNEGPQPLSNDIKDLLKSVSMKNAANATACFMRNRYHLLFPDRGDGTCLYLIYDFVTSTWQEMSQLYTTGRYLYGDTGASDGDEVLLCTTSDFRDPSGNSYIGIVRLFTDNVTSLRMVAHSGDLFFGAPHLDKKICSVRVLGSLDIPNGQSVTLTLTATKQLKGGLSTTNTATYTLLEGTDTVLLDADTDSSLVGQRISYRIEGVANTAMIDMIEFGYAIEGDRRN